MAIEEKKRSQFVIRVFFVLFCCGHFGPWIEPLLLVLTCVFSGLIFRRSFGGVEKLKEEEEEGIFSVSKAGAP